MTLVYAFDMDSTIAHTEHRAGLINQEDRSKTDWVAYSMACANDGEGPAMSLIRACNATDQMYVIISRRDNEARELTMRWLGDHNVSPLAVMLLKDEFSSNDRTQAGWKLQAIKDYEQRSANRVVLMVDDNPAVIEAVTAAGYNGLQVFPDYVSEFAKGL